MEHLKSYEVGYPDPARGYIILRDGNLNTQAWEKMETWCQGDDSPATIEKYLRQFEKPLPGNKRADGHGSNHLVYDGYDEEEEQSFPVVDDDNQCKEGEAFLEVSIFTRSPFFKIV